MHFLSAIAKDAATLVAVGGVMYTVLLAVVAITSVAARTPGHRRDARATLAILMKRRPPR
ncbi:hypothetical protein [Streptomyces sp. NPDC056061]|uniref:hypothetical protein n=1 Tax=Streptomyces sp. NPDC056061 TaxID=3345700 RepID=UPI0035E009AC